VKIRALTYDDEGNPATGTFEMTIHEMAYLTKLLGQQSGTKQEETLPGSSRVVDCFGPLDAVFVGHWEDGVDQYVRERR
jgi:hypothetical protein